MPAALLPSMRSVAYRETNVLRPMKAMERHTTASESRTKDALSSFAVTGDEAASDNRVSSTRSTGRHSAAPTTAGSTSSGVRPSPPTATTAATMTGASAKPRLPPSENHPIALWLPSLATLATRADSGWYAATPTPDTATTASVTA
ncbi:hypothetical protein SHIRM173S_01215 [Streptomyces hirsutus]